MRCPSRLPYCGLMLPRILEPSNTIGENYNVHRHGGRDGKMAAGGLRWA